MKQEVSIEPLKEATPGPYFELHKFNKHIYFTVKWQFYIFQFSFLACRWENKRFFNVFIHHSQYLAKKYVTAKLHK